MNKKLKILFFCMIIVGGAAHSQVKMRSDTNMLLTLRFRSDSSLTFLYSKLNAATPVAPRPFIAANLYSKQLGFICRQEIKMDKLTKIPFRFRLGSVEQCNWLEGKRR